MTTGRINQVSHSPLLSHTSHTRGSTCTHSRPASHHSSATRTRARSRQSNRFPSSWPSSASPYHATNTPPPDLAVSCHAPRTPGPNSDPPAAAAHAHGRSGAAAPRPELHSPPPGLRLRAGRIKAHAPLRSSAEWSRIGAASRSPDTTSNRSPNFHQTPGHPGTAAGPPPSTAQPPPVASAPPTPSCRRLAEQCSPGAR